MQKEILYGIIGLLFGIFLTTYIASNAVYTNNRGITNMMGIRPNNMMSNNNLDRHFIEQMIPHHRDAISMADLALGRAEHSETKKLAANIKQSQSAEITKMKGWYKQWYGRDFTQNDDEQKNFGVGMMGQMHGAMMGSNTDITGLENAADFDKTFIEEMIPHHQIAVMMANMLLQGTTRPEMRGLAQDIIMAQTKEINEMRQWYIAWGY